MKHKGSLPKALCPQCETLDHHSARRTCQWRSLSADDARPSAFPASSAVKTSGVL